MRRQLILLGVLFALALLAPPLSIARSGPRLRTSDARSAADTRAWRVVTADPRLYTAYFDGCRRTGPRRFLCGETAYGDDFSCTSDYLQCWTDNYRDVLTIRVVGHPEYFLGKVYGWDTRSKVLYSTFSQTRTPD